MSTEYVSDPLAKILKSGLKDFDSFMAQYKDDINYLDIAISDNKKISYFDKNRELKVIEQYGDHLNNFRDIETRSSMAYMGKPIKVLKRFSSYTMSNTEEETIIAMLKGQSVSSESHNFEIVEGEGIRYWYHEDQYRDEQGSLSSSCMKYEKCQEFLDCYVDNPESIKLLILKDDDDLLLGRAILWKNIAIDRIYGNEKTIGLFKQYCEDNNLFCKYEQSYHNCAFINPSVSYTETVELPFTDIYVGSHTLMPYMDTFKYYDYNSLSLDEYHGRVLDDTEGNGGSQCSNCDSYTHEDEMRYTEYRDYGYCEECYNDIFVWSEHCQAEIRRDEAVEIDGEFYEENDCHTCNECNNDTHHSADEFYTDQDGEAYCSHECFSEHWVYSEDEGDDIRRDDAIEYKGEYYLEENCIADEIQKIFVPESKIENCDRCEQPVEESTLNRVESLHLGDLDVCDHCTKHYEEEAPKKQILLLCEAN